MRVTLISLVAGLSTLALAEAAPNRELRPRYYFPQQVKRQILGINLNNLTGDATTSSSDASQTPKDGLLDGLTGDGATSTGSGSSAAPTDGNNEQATTTGVSLGLSGVLDPTATPTPVSTIASDDGNLLSTLLGNTDPSPSATPTPLTTDPAVAQPTTTGDGNLLSSLLGKDPTTTAAAEPEPTTTKDGNILSSLLGNDATTTPAAEPEPTTTPGNIFSSILGTNPIPTSEPQPTTHEPSPTIVTPPPAETTSVAPQPTSEPSKEIPSTSVSPPGTTSVAQPPSSETSVRPSDVVTPSSSSGAPLAKSSEPAPTAIRPSATNSLTSLPEVSSIVTASSKAADTPSSTASSIPTNLPSSIQPNGGIPEPPANGTLIQLGFTYGLNYPFVVSNSWAVQQIFDYLPPGVANGVKITNKDVVMQYLQPYNTLSQLGYITTLAMAYIPDDQVNPLSLALLNPNSDLYNNQNPTVKTLMNMLDPSIPLIAGSSIGNGSPVNSANTNANGNNNGAAAGGEESTGGSSVKPSSIGIGVGVVGGAAVYGAAMFMVAKRYKKRKNAHKRSSSVTTDGSHRQMGENSTLMAGARNSYGSRQPVNGAGRDSRNSDRSRETGRTYISPPVATENSLGWN